MTIDDNDFYWESQPESRQIELFTGRLELRRLFAAYLNDSEFIPTILYFYGDGGNGKSLLLKFLQEKCCQRFNAPTWTKLKSHPDDIVIEIQKANDWNSVPVPSVLLDFGQQPRGENQPQDQFYGLLMLRRDIATSASKSGYRLQFPLYDFACFWYLYRKGNSREEIQKLFPSEEVELISTLFDAVSQSIWGSLVRLVVQSLAKHLSDSLMIAWNKRGLDEQWFQQLQSMALDTELIDELPRWFAQDLNIAMKGENAPERIVLFFDTHEAFWGSQHSLPEEKFFYQDEWLRRLLRALDLQLGIVVVVAGREEPRWDEAPKFPIAQKYLDKQLVRELTTAEASVYLHNAGISDVALAESLINYASVESDRVHPFYLGLCVDVMLAAAKHNITINAADFASIPETANKSRELIDRLLRYVDADTREAVHALSACRTFDLQLFLKLGQTLYFHATAPVFRILIRFSFVWQDKQRGENWYSIHNLLRRLDYERGNLTTCNAHRVLAQHYRQRQEIAEAIYHANRLDWEAGVNEWVDVMETALRLSQYHLCRQLLEVRNELIIGSDFHLGKVAEVEGHYFGRLARYDEALQQCQSAVAAFNRSLQMSPDCVDSYKEKVIALARLGQLYSRLCEYQAALESYNQALDTSNAALSLAVDDFLIHKYRGITLKRLGELQSKLSQHYQALQSYQQALAVYEEALRLCPDDTNVLNNKVNTSLSLAELLFSLRQYQEAWQSYQQALAVSQQVLLIDSNSVYAHHNQGKAKKGLAELHLALFQYDDAYSSYQDALSAFDQALCLAPNYIYAYNDKGRTLHSLGDWQFLQSQVDLARESYESAIALYNQALHLAPDSIDAHYNQGLVLKKLGDLYASLSQIQDALLRWIAADKAFSRCLEIAPASIDALREREYLKELLG
ncbi:tetratricopeptide repeat protein [Iningainema tapete]|uniref:Tetratricopeptide repeat protein n=1 Tax=Iningainema tapete BLCC-T55 TaxID=2748662 RepID=A0A8J7CD38_9CYAN|nr:tetratricopeptide repeat protein [Iningainema tapete]MBD2772620.1 tetratricopeptide repeat protein [Iningainema tapete BLCC-T55]